jgi:hypothetical protein
MPIPSETKGSPPPDTTVPPFGRTRDVPARNPLLPRTTRQTSGRGLPRRRDWGRLAGICAAVRLKEMGIPFVVLEKNENVGGTWGGSITFHLECQVRYVPQALREMIEQGYATIEVRTDVHDG